MNPKRIELTSINCLISKLLKCERLEPMISQNDKEPSWDGSILLYDNLEFKKDNVISIPIQVKGTFVTEFDADEIKRVVGKIDLINYRNHNGVFYIVVQIKDILDCKVYYRELLSTDISDILTQMGKHKTKTLTFKHFDTSTSASISSILTNFHNDRLKHAPSDIYTHDPSKFSKIVMQFTSPSDKIDAFLFDSRPIYGALSDYPDKLIPIDRVQLENVTTVVEQDVSIDGKVFYDKITKTKTKDSIVIRIGKAITILNTQNKESKVWEGKFNIKLKGTFKERYYDSLFIRQLIKKAYYEINGMKIFLPITEEMSKDVIGQIEVLDDINLLYAVLKINHDLIMDKITYEEGVLLKRLVDYFVNGNKWAISITGTGLLALNICNLKLKFVGQENPDGSVELTNIFKTHVKTEAQYILEDNGVELIEKYSLYLSLKEDDFTNVSNIDYDQIYCDIFERGVIYNRNFDELVVLFLLEVLKSYDKTKCEDLLDFANRIDGYLLSRCEDEIYIKLNHYQLIKRQRDLEKSELFDLLTLKKKFASNENSFDILFAISVVLDNKMESDFYLSQLNDEVVDSLKRYPIFNLYLGLN